MRRQATPAWCARTVSAAWSWRWLCRPEPRGHTHSAASEHATQGSVMVSYRSEPLRCAENAPLLRSRERKRGNGRARASRFGRLRCAKRGGGRAPVVVDLGAVGGVAAQRGLAAEAEVLLEVAEHALVREALDRLLRPVGEEAAGGDGAAAYLRFPDGS